MRSSIGNEEFNEILRGRWIWTVRIWRGSGAAFESRGWANEQDARIDAVGWIMRGARQVEIFTTETGR